MTRRLLPLLFCTLFAVNALASNEIEPVVPGPTAGDVSDIASANLGGRYLTVWRQSFYPVPSGIWGALNDGDGKPLGPAFQVLGDVNALSLHLYADGDSFLLVWDDSLKTEWMCHVDSSGHASTPKQLSPEYFFRLTFAAGRLITTEQGVTIFDDNGGTVRSGFASADSAFAGNGSFFLALSSPDLTLSRYSLDGDLLQTFTLQEGNCATETSPCWGISDLRELNSDTILLLVRGEQGFATMTIAADGTMSEKTGIPVSFPEVISATLQRTGSQTWAVLAGGPSDGPYEVEAQAVDGNGIPSGDPVLILRDVRSLASFVTAFPEGPDGLLAVGAVGDRSQVETALFRGGTAGDQQIVSITPSMQNSVQVASNGSSYLAAWINADGLGFPEVHCAVLDATGQRRSAVFTDGGGLDAHSLVSNGQDYLMLVDAGGPLLGRRIAADGTFLGDTILPTVDVDNYMFGGAAAVATSAGYVVVWSSGEVVSSVVLTPSGTVSTPQELFQIEGVPDGRAAAYMDPALTSNGSEVLLIIRRIEGDIIHFPGDPTNTTAELDAFQLSGDGSLVTPDPLQLSTAVGNYGPPLAASDGQEFLVAADDERFEITPAGLANMVATTGENVTDLTWDGQSYVLARDGDAFEHVARDGSTLDSQSRHGVVGLDVAADSSGHLLLVGSQSSVAGPLRAFSYTPSDFVSFTKRRRAILP